MPRTIVITRRFEQAYRKLPFQEQRLVDAALRNFRTYLETGQASASLGLKQLHRRTYELRVGLSLRIIYVVEAGAVYLALLGRHDDVRRFLRHQ